MPYRLPRTALVVSDDDDIRPRLESACASARFSVTITCRADEMKKLLAEELPQLLLLDWAVAGHDGVALTRELRCESKTARLPIVMTSPRAFPEDAIAALEAGADDYVVRPFSENEFLARINAVVRRCAPELSDQEVTFGPVTIRPSLGAVQVVVRNAIQKCAVAPTEFRLLHFLMTHPEVVHSRTQLRDRIWPREACVLERTVDVQVRRLRDALAVVGLRSMIETVRFGGYRLTLARLE
ncbi:winged helix-turn-helix domain-containing protein [Variovorax sp. LARHSF232]